jgi:phosphate transport system protein
MRGKNGKMEEKRHTSKEYERELQEIKEGLLYIGAMIEKAIVRALQALTARDTELAQKVVCEDDEIDRLDIEIEEKCIRVLALRQPTARDLRFITTAIKINGHLERIGDMAANIAEKVILLNEEPQMKPYIDIPRMAEIAQGMLRESLDSLVREDVILAEKVRRDDGTIDELNEQIFRELLVYMMENTQTIHRALLVSQISKNLERIADHAVGVADMVIYMVTGKSVRHETHCNVTENRN